MDNAHRLRDIEWLKKLQKQGRRVKSLEKEIPDVWPISMMYWNAFQYLGARRGYTEGFPDFIQVREIDAYCNMSGITRVNIRVVMLEVIGKVDTLFVERTVFKIQKDREKAQRAAERK